ncbi:hypothetical protein GCM10009795_008340 [Nocardioides hankookensis]|uniref:Uncharacterized protein n=1 Tax=Nocardioides hankookensis TaxID=443157 RepID=A0ABW1LIB3_9ACTN
MGTSGRRLSGRQVTVMFVAGCLTLVLLPWGAFAAGKQIVTITGKGGHKVAVTKSNALKVSDGKGAMTVDGKVTVQGPVTTTQAGTPFQVVGSGGGAIVVGQGKVALTDLVMSQTNTAVTRLNVSMRLQAGNADCSTTSGPVLGRLIEYSFLQPEEILPVTFTTPVVVEADTVCLVPSIGSNPGLFFNYTVNGYTL